ncbi:MAG TPA: hypothetical protein VIG76_00795 [Amnibacterium sp.]|jgi:hypothetical protein|uniref:hypothetical protein n=1 Tax=Amnibacterium sp. TaxID=1872496 RepID=UPI002F9383EE
MCRAVTCKQCGKTTWAGCGQHVDQVMSRVSPADRCAGHLGAGSGAPEGRKTGPFARLFGGR